MQPFKALRCHDPTLAQRSSQRVRRHPALAHQQRPGAVYCQRRLLRHALHRHEPHRRPADRLADRLGIPAVVLVALHIRLPIGRRHQPHLVAVAADYPCPMVRAAAGLHAHRARRQLRKKLLNSGAPKLTPQHHRSRCINPVNLEHVLRQIQTNHANLAHGRLPCLVESTSPVWHTDAVGGRPHHLCEPTGRANARPMTGSAKQSIARQSGRLDCFVAALLAMTTSDYPRENSSARNWRAIWSSTAFTMPVSSPSTKACATSTYSDTTTRPGTSLRCSSS